MNAENALNKTTRHANTGYGPQFAVLEIGLPDRVAVVEPDTAFWALVERDALEAALSGDLVAEFQREAEGFRREMDRLRFGLKPSAAYFNPTERCNLNCSYCYLPEDMRRSGKTMTADELCGALERLDAWFQGVAPEGFKPQLIFHSSERGMRFSPGSKNTATGSTSESRPTRRSWTTRPWISSWNTGWGSGSRWTVRFRRWLIGRAGAGGERAPSSA